MKTSDYDRNRQRFVAQPGELKLSIDGSADQILKRIAERTERERLEGMKKYMPLGSVVTLDDSEACFLMIIGYNPKENADYLACYHPYGLCQEHGTVMFRHEEIERVYDVGYIEPCERAYRKTLLADSYNKKTGKEENT